MELRDYNLLSPTFLCRLPYTFNITTCIKFSMTYPKWSLVLFINFITKDQTIIQTMF